MGLAASQARLLLLTARKSDLEFRAQLITNRKMLLAMQSEEIANKYSRALQDRTLYLTYFTEINGRTSEKEEQLTYANLTAVSNTDRYRIVDPSTGEILILNEADKAKYESSRAGTYTATQTDGAWGAETPTATETLKYSQKWTSILHSPEAFQQAIQSGRLIVEKLTTSEAVTNEETNTRTRTFSWAPVAVSGEANIRSRSNTDNDAAATANYEYESLVVQNADKQLDVELKQIETQQKACENEIDSVKKVLDKNIEKSFKTFA